MKFAILVNEGPYTHQASDSAYNFAAAALKLGHEVIRVFFYHDGVNNGTRLTTPPQDDRHITNRWSELAQEHSLDLRHVMRAYPGDEERLRQAIVDSMAIKPRGHDFDLNRKVVIMRHMSVTGG